MRVLFVEDELELNDLATGQLRRQGHEVVSVGSVGEAQAVIEGGGPKIECVITDHRLPDGFGVAFCVHCRVHHPEIVVGVVSGCLTAKDCELMKEYAVPYWVKPILYSQVAAELEKGLPTRAQEREALQDRLRNAPILAEGSDAKRAGRKGFFKRVFGA